MTRAWAALDPLLAVAAATLDETGSVIEANAGFLRLIGGERSQLRGVSVQGFFIQPDFATLVGKQVGSDGEVHRGLLTMQDHGGQTRSLRATIWRTATGLRVLAEYDVEELERLYETVLQLNADYGNAQFEVVQTNLTLRHRESQLEQSIAEVTAAHRELEQTQTRLRGSEKLASIGRLAAGVAHEINNPIGFVSGNLGALKHYIDELFEVIDAYESAEVGKDDLSSFLAAVNAIKINADLPFLKEDLASLFAESREGLDRVKGIVQGLKDFSGVDSTEGWKDDDIRKGIESTLSVVQGQFKSKCEVRTEYAELPPVKCVLAQLNQVFMNLLLNAAQSIAVHGVITIRTGRSDDEVWVEITDTGEGIPAENLSHVFDPFFTTWPVGTGAGLGLSVSHSIVERHHGRIEVRSETGKGSSFRVWLPIRQPAASAP